MTVEKKPKYEHPSTVPTAEGLAKLLKFVVERHNIYLRRKAGLPREEWTSDPVLKAGHFCNVYRELDRVSVWIRENWRDPHKIDRSVIYAMFVARLINCTETLEAIGYPDPKDVAGLKAKLWELHKQRPKLFSSAYLVVGSYTDGIPKIDWLCDSVLPNIANKLDKLLPFSLDTLARVHSEYVELHEIGSFLAAQVIADLKYTDWLRPYDKAWNVGTLDWDSWCAVGTGSKRGRNRVAGLHPEAGRSDKTFLSDVSIIREYLNSNIPPEWEKFHAQDTQNCLCEFDKYCRALDSGKSPRRKYKDLYSPKLIQGTFL